MSLLRRKRLTKSVVVPPGSNVEFTLNPDGTVTSRVETLKETPMKHAHCPKCGMDYDGNSIPVVKVTGSKDLQWSPNSPNISVITKMEIEEIPNCYCSLRNYDKTPVLIPKDYHFPGTFYIS